MSARLLCVGDVHLGRRPTRLSQERLTQFGLSARELGPRAAWERAVDRALGLEVDAVLLAGDVVESSNRFFEAYGPLKDGVRRLVGAGIEVVAVAGNHDTEVLPRLADEIADFRLLGATGEWEACELARDTGGAPVRILGWSFPRCHFETSPLALPVPQLGRDGLNVGLLHGDLDQVQSRYAPIDRADLIARSEIDVWLLGHIHEPARATRDPRTPGYLGSLVGLHPGEPGRHGPWLLEWDVAQGLRLEHLPIAPLRWEEVSLSVEQWDGPEDLERALVRSLEELRESIEAEGATPRAVGVRVVLVDASPGHAELARLVQRWEDDGLPHVDRGDCVYFVHEIRDRARLRVDLLERAQGLDPAGLLARRLLSLEGDAELRRQGTGADEVEAKDDLLERARRLLEEEAARSVWAELAPIDVSDEAVRARLSGAAWHALAALEEGRETR